MKRSQLIAFSAALLAGTAVAADTQQPGIDPNQVLGKVPLAFEANVGQTDPQVRYLARGNGYTAFLTANGAVLALSKRLPRHSMTLPSDAAGSERGSYDTLSATVRMRFQHATAQPVATPSGPLAARLSYLSPVGSARVQPTLFQKVSYADVWPGVSVVFYGSQSYMEYDFVVQPGRSPSAIKLAFDGAQAVQVDSSSGDLVLTTGIGELRQSAPVVYQEVNGQRVQVDGRYTVAGTQVGFQIGSFDSTKPLVIDPTLTIGEYYGGSGQDYATSVAVNQNTGEIYVAGYTDSPDFPVTTGQNIGGKFDAFVSKISADGTTLLFSTFIGGSYNDVARGIALDRSGNAYITGYTESNNFPTACSSCAASPHYVLAPAQIAAKFFVVELAPSGSVLSSRVYGGGNQDYGNAIGVSADGSIVAVTGRTYSPDFPIVGNPSHLQGASDAFLTLIQMQAQVSVVATTPGEIFFSTLIGGSGDDSAKSIALITNGSALTDAIVAGWTSSPDFPVTGGVWQSAYRGGGTDGFVTRIQFTIINGFTGPVYQGSTFYSTYVGGEDWDIANSVTVDATGAAYVTGYTHSHYFPTTFDCFQPYYGGGYSDAFIVKLDSYGRLRYSSYFGGSGDDYGEVILVGHGYIYLVGYTDSCDLPVFGYPFQNEQPGGWDTFAAIFLYDDFFPVYSSYFGTWGDDFAYGGALDGYGNLVFAGSTDATHTRATNVLLLKLNLSH